MSEVIETLSYDEMQDRLVVKRTQDTSEYLRQNTIERNETPEFGKYTKTLTKVASIPEVVVEMMMRGQCCQDGKRYNLLAVDPEERRRALVHLQTEHKALMTITGTPFSRKRLEWE